MILSAPSIFFCDNEAENHLYGKYQMAFCSYALLLCCTACKDGINLALLLCLHALLDEDVRDGDTDDNGEDDCDTVDTEPQSLKQFLDGDGLNVENCKEEAIEEDAGDEWDDRWDDEQGVRCVYDVDDLECGDADDGRGGE